MIPLQRVVGRVAAAPDLIKEPRDIRRQQPLRAQPVEEIGLAFLRGGIEASARRQEPRQQLSKLAQLEQTGVGIISEVAFSQQAQPHELFVMRLQVRKISRGQQIWIHSDWLGNGARHLPVQVPKRLQERRW